MYVFGGFKVINGLFKLLDNIERYNTDLDIWIALEIKSPVKIASCMACVVDDKYIAIFGGVIDKIYKNNSFDDGVLWSSGKVAESKNLKELIRT